MRLLFRRRGAPKRSPTGLFLLPEAPTLLPSSAIPLRDDPGRRPAGNPAEAVQFLLRSLPDQPAALETLAARATDWNAIVAYAERHGVLGVLHTPLLTCGMLPPAVQEHLRWRRELEQMWEGRQQEALAALLSALQTAGLPTVLLKGPLLGERLYGDASVRRSTDLDLLIAADHLEPALHG
jgi:hypothetical protein